MKNIYNKCKNSISLTLMGAFVHKSQDGHADRRRIMYSTISWNLILNLTTAVFLTQFYLALAVSKSDSGTVNVQEFVGSQTNLIVIIAALSGIVQIITPFVLERLTSRKKLLITLRVITHTFNIIFATFLPLFVDSITYIAPIMLVCYTVMYLSNAFLSPGIMAWQVGSIPKEKQLGFFSFQGLINTVITGFAIFFSAMFADFLTQYLGALNAYVIVRAACLILVAIDIISLLRLYEPVFKHRESSSTSPKVMFGDFIRNKPYLAIIGFVCLFNFSCGIPSQYFIIYLRSDLGMSNTLIQVVQIANILCVVFLTAFWKKLIAKYGIYKFLALAMMCISLHGFFYLFVNENTYQYAYPLAATYWYIFYVGIGICFAIIPFQHLPEKNRTFFLSMYAMCGGIATFLGSVLGRFINSLLGGYIYIFNYPISPGQVLYFFFFISFLTSGFIMLLLTKYIKKNEAKHNEG